MAEALKAHEPPSQSNFEMSSQPDGEKPAEGGPAPKNDLHNTQYPQGLALALILISVLMALFLVSLASLSTLR